MPKKLKKQVKGLIGTGMLLGVGSIGIGAIGGSGAAAAQTGLTQVGTHMPLMGTVTGAGGVMRVMDKMPKLKKHKKKRGY